MDLKCGTQCYMEAIHLSETVFIKGNYNIYYISKCLLREFKKICLYKITTKYSYSNEYCSNILGVLHTILVQDWYYVGNIIAIFIAI